MLRLIDAAYAQLANNSEQYPARRRSRHRISTVISRSGRIAAFMDLEGGFDLDGDLAISSHTLYRLGLPPSTARRHWFKWFRESAARPRGGTG